MKKLPKIKYATLLSVEEAETLLTEEKRKYENFYWLRSPGYFQDSAALANDEISYDRTDMYIWAVRPALKINLASSNYKIGDTFKFGGKAFRILSNSLAFCTQDIGIYWFRKDYEANDANDYIKSDIKKYVDKWFADVRMGRINKEYANMLNTLEIKERVDDWFEMPKKMHKQNESNIDIINATLLSVKETKKLLTKEERKYRGTWWLRSPGFSRNYASYVDYLGSVHSYGDDVHDDFLYVRPALKINLSSSNFKIGDTFTFGGKLFRIISNEFAFCLKDIGRCSFRKNSKADDANDYTKSDIKKIVDEWFMDAKKYTTPTLS